MAKWRHGLNSYLKRCKIEKIKRRQRVFELMLDGVVSRRELAAVLGVSQQSIGKDQRAVLKEMEEATRSTMRQRLARRLMQLERAAQKFATEFERSKRRIVKTKTTSTLVLCSGCGGKGGDCTLCGGTGKTKSVTETQEVVQFPGDAMHLKGYVDCVKEMARLERLYPRQSVKVDARQMKTNVVCVKSVFDLSSASPELLLKALRLAGELRRQAISVAEKGEDGQDSGSGQP